MEIQHVALTISAANFVLLWGIALYMYIINKNKVTNERIGKFQEDVEKKHVDHSSRIAKLEVRGATAPSHSDLFSIHEKINQVDASVSSLAGQFKGVRHLLDTIHEHLLRGTK